MNYEDTLCYKVDEGQKIIEKTVKTGGLSQNDLEKLAMLLTDIRHDATDMESALKVNKVLRLKHGIDPEFRKMMNETGKPSGINEIGLVDIREENRTDKQPKYEVTVREIKDDAGRIIYQAGSHALVLNTVEQIKDIDDAGMIEGITQSFWVGSDVAMWYSFDQLKQKVQGRLTMIALKVAGMGNLSRQQRRALVRHANNKRT